MPSMQRLLVLSSLALSALGSPSPRVARSTASTCSTPMVESNSSVLVGNNSVVFEVFTCPNASGLVADGLGLGNALCGILPIFCPPKPYKPKPKPSPKPEPTKGKTDIVTVTDTVTDVVPTTIIGTTTVAETTTEVVTATVTIAPSPTPSAIDVCGGSCTTTCSEVGQLPPTTDDCQVIKDAIAIFQGNASPTFVVEPAHIQQLTFGTCRFFFENLGTDSVEYCWNDLADTGSASASQCFPPSMPYSTLAVCEALDTTWEVGVSHS